MTNLKMNFLNRFIQLLGLAVFLLGSSPVWSATFFVTNNADAGVGSLRNALTNAVNGDVIQIQPFLTGGQTIALGSDLPVITQSIEIQGPIGNTVAIDGSNEFRAFFVQSGTTVISNLNIQNTQATGGHGADHSSSGGGGGGLGAGSGLFVNDGATVFLSKTNFIGNQAIGGEPGRFDLGINASGGGGGGGFSGDGGIGGVNNAAIGGGGGGGGGFSADGSDAGVAPLAGGGGGAEGGSGGDGANGGAAIPGSDAAASFGGGGGGGSGATLVAGADGGEGAFGGGGGGGGSSAGAFDGGDGGDGGFGAGGCGRACRTPNGQGGTSAYGGGNGETAILVGGRGGGGAAFGGAIFVSANGTLNIVSPGFVGNSVTAGSGGSPSAAGPDLFLRSSSNTTISVPAGQEFKFASGIAGDNLLAGGGLTVTGDGRLILEGDNTYYVPTTVSGGNLRVNGSLLNSDLTVLQNGILSGIGYLGNVTNEGTIIPGSPFGTLNAVNYLQSPTARFHEHISPGGSHNILSVSNNVQLTGGHLQVTVAPGFYALGQTFPVIQGGTVNGEFSSFSAPFDLGLFYSPSQVFLLARESILLIDFPLDCNALRVADYINSLNIPFGSDLAYALSQLPIGPEATQAALDELHPALFQDLTLVTGENLYGFREKLTSRNEYVRYMRNRQFPGLFNNACNIGVTPFWLSMYDMFINQAHRGCLRGYRASNPGIAMGYDSQPNKCFTTGVALGYTFTDLHWKRHPGKKGKATVESIYMGCYSSWFNRYFYFDASFSGSYEWYFAKRHINWLNCEDFDDCGGEGCAKPKNRHHGYALDAYLGGGARLETLCGILEPFAGIDYEFVDQDGYRETGAQSLNLRVKANHAHMLRSEGGLALSQVYNYNCARVRPSIYCSYVRKDILQGERFKSKFICTDEYFDAVGTRESLNMINPGIAVEVKFHNNYIFLMSYDAELNRKQQIQNIIVRFERSY